MLETNTTITITYDCPYRSICSDNGVKCETCANNPKRSYYKPVEPPYVPYIPYIPWQPSWYPTITTIWPDAIYTCVGTIDKQIGFSQMIQEPTIVTPIMPTEIRPPLPDVEPTHKGGRPKGTKDRPGLKRIRRSSLMKAEFKRPLSPDDIIAYKIKVLEFLTDGQARTLSSAATMAGLPASRVHHWAREDKDFEEAINLAREIVADKIEDYLIDNKNPIVQIFLLKGYRPMFRENFKIDIRNPKLEELLLELKAIGASSVTKEDKCPQ